jgi:hypothetical protein
MTQASVKKYVPARYLSVTGKNLPAILNAVNQGVDTIEQTIQACIDQMFLTTASGKYLINLGEQEGFALPPNSGLDIRAFKVLVPLMVSSPKQVRITINDLIQAFYGSERTKPNITSSVFGPYQIVPGDDLVVETESGTVSITVLQEQVSNLSSVSAIELSAIINYSQDLILADTITDRQNGAQALRITSKTSGTSAYIKITGGKLQNVLKFPHLNNTTIDAGTTWDITKTSALTDEVTFTWDGVGSNPSIFQSTAGDVLTIRGLTDGAFPLSKLNGSYKLLDVGYDYFTFRNADYTNLTSSFSQPDVDNLVFTQDVNNILFDLSEYAFSSEVEGQTITITVPAIPPLALRFLQGSAHLQGIEAPVVDFTRSTIQITIPPGSDKPVDINQFVLQSPFFRYDFNNNWYLTYLSNSNTTSPTYQIETTNDEFIPFPYTTPTPVVGSNLIYGTVGSSEYKVSFPAYEHGLQNFWGVTFDGATGSGNVLAGDINKENQVTQIIDQNNILVRFKNSSNQPIPYAGVSFGPINVYRQSMSQSDGSDGYLEYPSSLALIAAGFTPGDVFVFNPAFGVDVNPFYASKLKFGKSAVTSIINTGSVHRVQFSSGIGVGTGGLVISAAQGNRSGFFGGSALSYYFDKTSDINQERVMSGLKALFLNYTPSSNTSYVGSFIYDPTESSNSFGNESSSQFTISKFVTKLTNTVLKGETVASILVESLSFGDEFFPDAGSLIVGYGTDELEGPIRYYSTIDNGGQSQIIIDPAYKFKFTHQPGVSVQYIHASSSYTPKKFGEDYPVYITGTTASREAMFGFIRLLTATGIFVEQDVLFPELTNDDPAIFPFD